jgi:hypothetical protein
LRKTHKHYRPAKGANAPPPNPKPIPENNAPNTHQAACKAETEKKPSSEKFDIAMLRWTRIVGLFTAVLAAVGSIQAWAFIQSERANLTATNFGFIGGFAANKQLVMLFSIKNSGKAAAELRNASITTKTGLPEPLEYDKLYAIASGPIVAGASEPHIYNGLNKDGTPFILNEALIKTVSAGTIKFYVYGFIDYDDDFTLFGPRRSKFCYLYLPDRSSPDNAAFGGCPITQ